MRANLATLVSLIGTPIFQVCGGHIKLRPVGVIGVLQTLRGP